MFIDSKDNMQVSRWASDNSEYPLTLGDFVEKKRFCFI
ncbi:hypothetical protein yrohd0001_19670 [Yersinia rohdei ATCC 43380]|nr:hypothetical protein yrohd0001_19670 [Yersinia rohdei ATCC 43380]